MGWQKFYSYEEAERRIESARENLARRAREQLDPMDCALSNWADSNSSAHFVKACYELGEELGVAGPVDSFWRLVDEDGNPVDAKMVWVEDRYSYGKKPKWVMGDHAAKSYGRKWWPFNGNGKSRVLKAAGLREEMWYGKVEVFDANCAFVGAPISYFSVNVDVDWLGPVDELDSVRVAREEVA